MAAWAVTGFVMRRGGSLAFPMFSEVLQYATAPDPQTWVRAERGWWRRALLWLFCPPGQETEELSSKGTLTQVLGAL